MCGAGNVTRPAGSEAVAALRGESNPSMGLSCGALAIRLREPGRLMGTSPANALQSVDRSGDAATICTGPKGWWITGDNTATPAATDAPQPLPSRYDATAFPMALTPDDVTRIAQLARLELQAPEHAAMLVQLNGFFRVVEQMSAVDTTGVEPLYTPLSAVQEVSLRLRDDVVTETDRREANQRSAPAVEDGLFLVPKVLGS
jgi:aspartyl-tRNA(Asn)/glutamyl-tRNA(Gln) amidotransferase subunit C